MEHRTPSSSAASAQLAAALDWWREAGVECDYTDQPIAWLSAPVEELPPAPVATSMQHLTRLPAAPPAPETIGDDARLWPRELPAFQEWWLTEPTLDPSDTTARVRPRGPANADLMILVAQPELQDTAELLSGPQGKLLGAMLAATGMDLAKVYLAAAIPRHTPLVDWADLAERGLGPVLLHHVALVAPRRLLVLGSNVLPLLGNDLAHSPAFLPGLNHDGGNLPVLGAVDLGALLARPRSQARFWERWLDWTG